MNKIYIMISVITVIIIGMLMYDKLAFLTVFVKFDDLEPFEKQMNVYYKGFKIGKTTKIYPDKEYKNTYIRLKLYPNDIKLPDNITAKIQNSKTGGKYINIIYPNAPSLTLIKRNDVIKGILAKDINSYMNDDSFSSIVSEISTLLDSANGTVQNLGFVFNQVNEILLSSKRDIQISVSNLAKTTAHIENTTANVNTVLDKEMLKTSADNIEETTKYIRDITSDLNNITTQIDKVTIPLINSTICQTYSTIKNTNEITGGIKNTLKKNFGVGRLLFGKPVDDTCSDIYKK